MIAQQFCKTKPIRTFRPDYRLHSSFSVSDSLPFEDHSLDAHASVVYDFLRTRRKVVVITGAGCSTDSGIPDYRGKNGTYTRANYKPMTWQQYIASHAQQQRYWYRSVVGWPTFSSSQPCQAHLALNGLLELGRILHIITQNVDRLHHKALAPDHHSTRHALRSASELRDARLTELHGTIYEAICVACHAIEDRHALQTRLLETNPLVDFMRELERVGAQIESDDAYTNRPDGDTETLEKDFSTFNVPRCQICNQSNNVLKPNVVLFGENVPVNIVQSLFDMISQADGVLVVGSTLTVYSSWRFVKRALENGIPVGVVNQGETRADEHASFKIDRNIGELFAAVLAKFQTE